MKRLLREPLLRFLFIGAALFGLYSLVNQGEPDRASKRIAVTKADVERIKAAWGVQWKREPTEAELNNLIQDHIREEVLYREALALGLERDDEIVRRRLALKMEFLVQDAAPQTEPDEPTLQNFFAAHKERYQEAGQVSFSHIYFSRDHRARPEQEAQAVLNDLQRSPQAPLRAPERGDRFMFAADYAQKTEPEIAREFGEAFAHTLFASQPGEWHGPIESGYGIHLIRVQERTNGQLPEFAVVKNQVRQDYLNEKHKQANTQAIEQLRKRYQIEIAPAAAK